MSLRQAWRTGNRPIPAASEGRAGTGAGQLPRNPGNRRDRYSRAPFHVRIEPQPGNLKSATERRRSAANCARLPIDSAVWLAPCEVCEVIS